MGNQHPPRPDRARASALKVEWDAKFHLVKINPLADWTTEKVWRYIHDHDLPYNALHDRGYPSIGCTHCTRSVQPGEDARAGRWSGFNKTECGLHSAESSSAWSPSTLIRQVQAERDSKLGAADRFTLCVRA